VPIEPDSPDLFCKPDLLRDFVGPVVAAVPEFVMETVLEFKPSSSLTLDLLTGLTSLYAAISVKILNTSPCHLKTKVPA